VVQLYDAADARNSVCRDSKVGLVTNDKRRDLTSWRVSSSELVLNNRWAKVRCDSCELGDGRRIPDYYYWDGGHFAQIFALTADATVVLTRQYKHGVKEVVIELPAGLVEPSDDDPLVTAKRELLEETGYSGRDWFSLGQLNVSSAKATTHAYPFLARDVYQAAPPSLDAHEDIEVFAVSISELKQMIMSGKIRDSNSIAATLIALEMLGRNSA
jgi:8-oxo-dGTP pyrophosphatase MutT (NUDIX family)